MGKLKRNADLCVNIQITCVMMHKIRQNYIILQNAFLISPRCSKVKLLLC